MRDPKRMPLVLAALHETWIKNPDWRLTQLLVNVIQPSEPCPDIFYLEDEDLLKQLAVAVKKLSN